MGGGTNFVVGRIGIGEEGVVLEVAGCCLGPPCRSGWFMVKEVGVFWFFNF